MRNGLFRFRHNGERQLSTLAAHTHDMVRQLAFPLVPERRVKGALHVVSRDTGVSYSKLRKLYYRLSDHILAVEWQAIKAAHARWLDSQEQKLTHELENLRALRAARQQVRFEFDVGAKNDTRPVDARVDLDSNAD